MFPGKPPSGIFVPRVPLQPDPYLLSPHQACSESRPYSKQWQLEREACPALKVQREVMSSCPFLSSHPPFIQTPQGAFLFIYSFVLVGLR